MHSPDQTNPLPSDPPTHKQRCTPKTDRSTEATRRDLVAKIRAYIASQQASGNQSIQLLDLDSQFDWWSMSEGDRAKIFDDGIHYTDYGYQQHLAGLIYTGLVKILKL